MAYNMRTREQKNYNASSSSSESQGNDSIHSDPNFTTSTSTSQRRPRKNTNVNTGTNNNPGQATGVGSSSRDNVNVIVPKRSAGGRPSREESFARPEDRLLIKRRRRTIMYQKPRRTNRPNREEFQQKDEELARCRYNLVESAANINDDACMICSEGGALICCLKCPSTFHENCMVMERIAGAERMCPFCICFSCGTDRPGELHECKQCERRYHLECVSTKSSCSDSPTTFCGNSCEKVFSEIQKILGVRNVLGDGFTWRIVRMMLDGEPDSNSEHLHRNIWTFMDEIFLPCIDHHTGINIIQSVVYNCESNLRRINFRNFYTAILEKDDELICVASIRLHGTKIAEMPFVGTREKLRQKQMMRKLFTQIEFALPHLKVEHLVIPSKSLHVPMWTEKFGFSPIENGLRNELVYYNTLMFPDAVRLHKSLAAHAAGPSVAAGADVTVEVDEQKNSETGMVRGKCYTKVAFFDLNGEPPEEDDDT